MSDTKPNEKRARGYPRGRIVDPGSAAELSDILGDTPRRRDLLVELLHLIQDRHGCLPAPLLAALAESLQLSTVEVYEVATFYHHFDVVEEGAPAPASLTIRVCDSISCALAGAEALADELEVRLGDRVRVQRVPCVGRCAAAPVAVSGSYPIEHATAAAVEAAVAEGRTDAPLPVGVRYAEYRNRGGYETVAGLVEGGAPARLAKTIDTLEQAGLRGLGGAGFPVARKWRSVMAGPMPRLMTVNIDEGEPGTFKDRHYLETDPHRCLEGMLIAAWAVGAEAVYLYLRDEYAGCRDMLQREFAALIEAQPCDLPAIHLRRGAGSYVCGEESAMLESIEGRRGVPRLRPPYVAERGLFDRPTLVHNLETLYWIRDILEKGADWFVGSGRRGCPGLRAFSVSGRVARPGVYLAPAGITVRELIHEYCGGMLRGHRFQAYLPGGASGGILPAALDDLPLDFGTLEAHGCFVGSGAVIVLSDQDDVRRVALNTMRFFAHESCGRCTPCRVGTDAAAQLMAETPWERNRLQALADVMADASICGLGRAAPNALRSVFRHFPEVLD